MNQGVKYYDNVHAFVFTNATNSRPRSIDLDGRVDVGWLIHSRLLVVVNRHKRDAALTLYMCLKRIWKEQFGPNSFYPPFFSRLCRDYVMIGLNAREYWEHLVKEPFLNKEGELAFNELKKKAEVVKKWKRNYEYMVSRRYPTVVARAKRFYEKEKKEFQNELNKRIKN